MIIHWPWLFQFFPHFDGICFFLFIFMKEKDPPKHLIEHERTHIKQQLKYCFIVYAILYFYSREWQYQFELEAYTVSVKNGLDIMLAATILSGPAYNNIVTFDKALYDLKLNLDNNNEAKTISN